MTEQHLEFLSLKGGCRGSSESTLVEMSNCWKSHAAAHSVFKFKGPRYVFFTRALLLCFQNTYVRKTNSMFPT